MLGILLMPWSSRTIRGLQEFMFEKEEREDLHSTQEHMVRVGKHVMKLRSISGR